MALALLLVPEATSGAGLTSPYLDLAWTRVGASAVLSVGAPGAWDSNHVIAGPVIRANAAYYMFYTGSSAPGTYQIGLATSTNGVNWTKAPANPVIPDGRSAAALYENGRFELWYESSNLTQIRYATSPDGGTWNQSVANPALVAGLGWDSAAISPGAVIHNGTGYYMYYSGTTDLVLAQGGLATSTDGLHWTKSALNPVLPWGLSGAWDAAFLVPCGMLDAGSARVLWYVGGSSGTSYQWRLGVAVSQDGVHWTASNHTALSVSSQGGWDSAGLSRAYVVAESSTLRMWYSGEDASGHWQVGMAQATIPGDQRNGPPSGLPGLFETSSGVLVAVGIVAGGIGAGLVAALFLQSRRTRRGAR